MIEDLLAVGDALDAAGLEYLLVRGDDNRPIIAIDRRRRKETAAALAAAFADEPFYVRSVDQEGDDLLVADGRLSRRKADVLRLYRPRVEPIGRLRYGADTAFQLEFWRFGDDEIPAPPPNPILRPGPPATVPLTPAVGCLPKTRHARGRPSALPPASTR